MRRALAYAAAVALATVCMAAAGCGLTVGADVPSDATFEAAGGSGEAAAGASGASGASAADGATPEATAEAASGEAAWFFDVETQDLDGAPFRAEAYRNARLTIVNLWATWCPPCVEELPALAQIAKDYESVGVQTVGVLLDAVGSDGALDPDAIDAAHALLADADAAYPSIVPEALLDERLIARTQYIPTTLLIDAEGDVLDTLVGGNDYDAWAKAVEAALEKTP